MGDRDTRDEFKERQREIERAALEAALEVRQNLDKAHVRRLLQ